MTLQFRPETALQTQKEALAFYERRAEHPLVRAFSTYGARKVEAGPTLQFVGVSEGIKRDGSKIHVPGIDLTNLRNNPVFMWAHQYDRPPVGRIVKVTRGSMKDVGRVLLIDVAPLRSDLDSEHRKFSDSIFDMLTKGDIRTVSFGWAAVEAEPIRDEGGFFTGWDFKRSDALEFSAVPIPADPEALMTAIRSYGLSDAMVDRFIANRQTVRASYTVRDINTDWTECHQVDEVTLQNEDSPMSNDQATAPVPPSPVADAAHIDPPGDFVSAFVVDNVTPSAPALGLREELSKWLQHEIRNANLDALLIAEIDRAKQLARIGAKLNSANRKALHDAMLLIRSVLESEQQDGAEETAALTTAIETRDDEPVLTQPSDPVDLEAWVAAQETLLAERNTARAILGQLAQKRARKTVSPKTKA